MPNEVSIDIQDKTLTKLAGYELGYKLYKDYVELKIDVSKPFTIKFPSQIDYLAASFIVGFFGDIYNQIGADGIRANMNIESNISNIADIEKTLLVM